MAETVVEALVEGGKASAGPQIGGTLGPTGVNIGEVISSINDKTKDFKGMKVPIKILVKEDKTFSIEIGTPPVSQLIKKELGLQKGSGIPNKQKVGNIAIEQVIKVANMKKDAMFVNNLKAAVKTVSGSANAMGLLIEGKTSAELNIDIEAGKFDNEISSEKTDVSPEKKQVLKEQLEGIQKEMEAELEKIKAQEEAEKAKEEEKKAEVEGEEKAAEEEGKEKTEEGKEEEKKPEEKKETKK